MTEKNAKYHPLSFSELVVCCYLGNENEEKKETRLCLLNCPRTHRMKVSQSQVAFCQEIA